MMLPMLPDSLKPYKCSDDGVAVVCFINADASEFCVSAQCLSSVSYHVRPIR